MTVNQCIQLKIDPEKLLKGWHQLGEPLGTGGGDMTTLKDVCDVPNCKVCECKKRMKEEKARTSSVSRPQKGKSPKT
jgi:hypothetical protein